MTSANLSWVDKVKANKKIMSNRNLWTFVLVLPVVFIAFIVPTVLWFIRTTNYGNMHSQSAEQILFEKQMVVMRTIGLSSDLYLLIGALGILYAFAKFSYLFSTSKLDFYLSLPTTSARRVQSAYMVALSNFTGIYLIVVAIAFLISATTGAVNTAVVIAVLIQTARMLVFFYACFTIATLAIMLSGTKLIALIFTAFLLCLPAVLGEEFHQFNRIFYRTSTGYDSVRRFLCPLFDANAVADYWFRYRYYSKEYVMDVPFILDSYRKLFLYDIDMILAAIIATVLVMVVYKHRRAEHVGKTIIYKPVRWAVKIIICIVTSLAGVVALNTVCHSIQSQYLYVIFGFAMLIICVITGGFVEICLDLDIKSFSKGRRQTLMAMAILLLIFFIYRGDLLGYDSYVPNPSSIESASIINVDECFGYYFDNSRRFSDIDDSYSELHMKLSDVDSVVKVARKGMECARRNTYNKNADGWNSIVSYNMKDGRKIYRNIIIPYDIDPALMDKLTGSEEYIKGHIPCFDDNLFSEEMLNSDLSISFEFDYYNGNGVADYNIPVKEFIDAYRQDVLEHYKYSFIREHSAVGEVLIKIDYPSYAYVSLYVYEDFTRSIEFLKKHGLYVDQKSFLENIDELQVYNAFVQPIKSVNFNDLSEQGKRDAFYLWYYGRNDYGSSTHTYTDKGQIKEILDNCTYDYYVDWGYPFDKIEKQYSVSVNENTQDVFERHFSFKLNSVPEFVIEDLASEN